TSGNQVGTTLTNAPTPVTNGLFTATLDFGPGVFPGPQRWLQIGVRPFGSGGPYTILAPRQQLTPSPYAITAANAATAATLSGTINGSQIAAGTITSNQLASGAAVANLSASGQSGVASGGVVLSADGNSSGLLNAGYLRIGRAELGELWRTLGLGGAPAPRYN